MEVQWYLDRHRLRCLRQQHPGWSKRQLAQAVGYSQTWVKKWCRRFDEAEPDDEAVLHSRSRARKKPPEPIAPEVVDEILKIRDDPPEGLKRVPGPVTILYYLGRSTTLKDKGYYLPKSATTVWRILDQHHRIDRPSKVEHHPATQAAPLAVMQMDFKDVPGVKVADSDKKQHQVETLNIIDTGTSILIDNPVRTDFKAETVIEALADTFGQWGLPQVLEFDRDPRFIGSWSADDYPSALMRFVMCLGVKPTIHPPHRPDKNGFVERLNKTYKYEAIQAYVPQSLWEVEDMNRDFRHHYNYQRPHQAPSCANQPPRLAFAQLPTLTPVPDQIDPDAWLEQVDGQLFKRRLDASGRFQLGKHRYYVRLDLAKHRIIIQLVADEKQLQVRLADRLIKTLPLKGLVNAPLAFEHYLALIKKEARSEWQKYRRSKIRYSSVEY